MGVDFYPCSVCDAVRCSDYFQSCEECGAHVCADGDCADDGDMLTSEQWAKRQDAAKLERDRAKTRLRAELEGKVIVHDDDEEEEEEEDGDEEKNFYCDSCANPDVEDELDDEELLKEALDQLATTRVEFEAALRRKRLIKEIEQDRQREAVEVKQAASSASEGTTKKRKL